MIQSGGVLLKTPNATTWQGTTRTWGLSESLLGQWWGYGELYKRQLWVAVLVNKIANASARLPLKVYERTDIGRAEVRDHPYAQLLRQPNQLHSPFFFWAWTVSTRNIYGEAFWGKIRDAGGRPVELVPLHPMNMRWELREGRSVWSYDDGYHRADDIPREDLVHFKAYNPSCIDRGLSPLEPLRATLENEEGSRRANSAMWRNGGRPSVVLEHPKTLSQPAADRLAISWADIHGGVDNWAKAAILEEGLTAKMMPLNVEELQYIESRKLNRGEVCAAFDVPPPVVHILDQATFSNITEQMRSMYRDSMAPKLKDFESTLECELRDGRFGADREPDFSDGVYGEFLMDDVLRGDFEVRADTYQKAINTGWMMPSEAREKENLPYVDGSDVLLVNSTLVPINTAGGLTAPTDPAQPAIDAPVAPQYVRSLMGRLSRAKTLDQVDPHALVVGLNGASDEVLSLYYRARADGLDVAAFRDLLRGVPHAIQGD